MYDAMVRGDYPSDPAAAATEIEFKTKAADLQLAGYQTHLTRLVTALRDVTAARSAHPLPAGPLVEIRPDRPTAPAGSHEAITSFDVFDFGKEN